jgi:hypothetical protein
MKKNKMAMISVTFILGAVFGISLIALFSFVRTPNPPSPNPLLTPISTVEANKLFHNYYDNVLPMNEKFKGFLVDRPQLEAINELAKDKNLLGFRIYMAKSDKAEKITIVVGITNPTVDAATEAAGKIFKTDSRISEPCPPLCGVNSPITK